MAGKFLVVYSDDLRVHVSDTFEQARQFVSSRGEFVNDGPNPGCQDEKAIIVFLKEDLDLDWEDHT